MRIRASRSRLIAAASLIVAGTFTVAVSVAAGLEPIQSSPIPDSAFERVVVPVTSTWPLADPSPTPDLEVLREPSISTPPPERPQPALPVTSPIVVSTAPKTTHAISGRASYYCRAGVSICTVNHPDGGGFDAYAAAGPALRAAIGPDWRGRIVYVDGIRVKLIDWCQCYGGKTGVEKLLDLYYDVYARTGSQVTIRW